MRKTDGERVGGVAKAARDAVRSRELIVQIGTQHRSEPYQLAAKEWIDSGVLGRVWGKWKSFGIFTGRAGEAAPR